MLIRTGEQITGGKQVRLQKKWVPIEEISPELVKAAITAEDQNFDNHWGFDFEAMQKAYKNNKRGKRIKGASTITQQTAKNVFLWPGRSYVRKAFEAYFTVLIEVFWSKKRIMEVYLNIIETGDGLYGVEAASNKYFGKPASKITKGEAALIIACIPNPRKFNPSKPSNYISGRKQWILKYMNYIAPVEWLKKK